MCHETVGDQTWQNNLSLHLQTSFERFRWACDLDFPGQYHRITDHLFVIAFPKQANKLLGHGKLTEGALTGTYSDRLFSTTVEIWTPDREDESPDDGLEPLFLYHFYFASFTDRQRSSALSKQALKVLIN